MPRGNPQNLIKNTDLTPEELSKRNSKAGKASVKARREKKLLSTIYAEFLAKEHEIQENGKKKKISGQALCNDVIGKIISRKDSAAVSMMKEVREGTEGNNINLNGNIKVVLKRTKADGN